MNVIEKSIHCFDKKIWLLVIIWTYDCKVQKSFGIQNFMALYIYSSKANIENTAKLF